MNLQHFGLASLPLYVAWFCRLDFGWHVLMFSKYFRRRRHLPFMILANFIKMWQSSGPEMLKVLFLDFLDYLTCWMFVETPLCFQFNLQDAVGPCFKVLLNVDKKRVVRRWGIWPSKPVRKYSLQTSFSDTCFFVWHSTRPPRPRPDKYNTPAEVWKNQFGIVISRLSRLLAASAARNEKKRCEIVFFKIRRGCYHYRVSGAAGGYCAKK